MLEKLCWPGLVLHVDFVSKNPSEFRVSVHHVSAPLVSQSFLFNSPRVREGVFCLVFVLPYSNVPTKRKMD